MPETRRDSGFLFPDMDPKKKEVRKPLRIEPEQRQSCQYCQDVGPCIYCKRGKAEIAAERRKAGQ